MDEKVNLADALESFDDAFSPRIVGYLNDYKVAVVKARGSFVWHMHEHTDDFFLVLSGRLTIQLRDRDVELSPGEMFVVPRGVEHCPRTEGEAHVLLIEPRGTPNTGAYRTYRWRRRGTGRLSAWPAAAARRLERRSRHGDGVQFGVRQWASEPN